MRLKPSAPKNPTQFDFEVERLRRIEPLVSSGRESGAAIGKSRETIRAWRNRMATLTPKELKKLDAHVRERLAAILAALEE